MTSPVPKPDRSSNPKLALVRNSPKPRSAAFWAIPAVTVLMLGAAWLFRPARHQAPAAVETVPTARAARGAIAATRRLAGSINAGRFVNIAAPVLHAPDQGRGLTLTFLAASGTRVKEGDVVAELDTADVMEHVDDVKADVAQSALDIKRRKAQYIAQLESLGQRLRVCKANLEKARQDLRAFDVKPAQQQEYLVLAVKEAQLEYDEVSKQIPLTDERQSADLRIYELSYQHQVHHLHQHEEDLQRCKIRSPLAGMVVLQTVYRAGQMYQIRLGDRLSPGQPFMRVVDPDSMQLEAAMSQTETELMRLGQQATVRFDAFPDIVVRGHVASLGAMAYNPRRINYWVRRVQIRIALDEQDDRVIPDLTASADVAYADPARGIVVPREAVVENDGKLVVYVKHEARFTPQPVEIAGVTDTQVAIARGIQEGDEVALKVP
jgi:multidrug resistance efflux pump